MSEPVNSEPPAPEQTELEGIGNVPIKFKPRLFESTAPAAGSKPTSRADCEAFGGHNPKKAYYPSGPKLGPLLGEPLICGVCGEVDI